MRYLLAEKSKALHYSFQIAAHVCKGPNIVLNEKEVMAASSLAGAESFEDRAVLLGASIYTAAELIDIINRQ